MRPSNTRFPDKGAYTHAEVSTGNRTVSTFREQSAREFLGDLDGKTREAWRRFRVDESLDPWR